MPRKKDIDDPRLLKILDRVSGNIERVRKDKKWSQAMAAEKLDTDLRWYQRLESGKHTPSLATLVRLTQIFKIDIAEFFKT